MSGKERGEFFDERHKTVDEYNPVLRWHCRLDEPKPKLETTSPELSSPAGGPAAG